MEIPLMFFKKTRTRRLIKNRYTKSRKRNSTNRQLEVWDSTLLEWVFWSSVLDQFPDPYYAHEYLDSHSSLVLDTFANAEPEAPVIRNQSENIADEWLEREPIKEPDEDLKFASFEGDILTRPSSNSWYSSSIGCSSTESSTDTSTTSDSSSFSCGGFD